jgi:hypothetical protein
LGDPKPVFKEPFLTTKIFIMKNVILKTGLELTLKTGDTHLKPNIKGSLSTGF